MIQSARLTHTGHAPCHKSSAAKTTPRSSQPTGAAANAAASSDWVDLPPFDPSRIDKGDFSLWRYAAMLPVPRRFSLGEGMTPLVPLDIGGGRVHAKLEYLNPTGSFKDRGVAVMLNQLAGAGVSAAMDNSSGNAGASLAAYAGLAGMEATVYVPAASAVESKKAHIRAYGGRIIESDNLPAEIHAAAERMTYASHAWNPGFALGQQTAAWEVWEQLGGRAPEAMAMPVGHGGLFLGCYRGFKALRDAGLIERIPRMIAVQSAGVDPIVRGWEQGAESPPQICTRGRASPMAFWWMSRCVDGRYSRRYGAAAGWHCALAMRRFWMRGATCMGADS